MHRFLEHEYPLKQKNDLISEPSNAPDNDQPIDYSMKSKPTVTNTINDQLVNYTPVIDQTLMNGHHLMNNQMLTNNQMLVSVPALPSILSVPNLMNETAPINDQPMMSVPTNSNIGYAVDYQSAYPYPYPYSYPYPYNQQIMINYYGVPVFQPYDPAHYYLMQDTLQNQCVLVNTGINQELPTMQPTQPPTFYPTQSTAPENREIADQHIAPENNQVVIQNSEPEDIDRNIQNIYERFNISFNDAL